MIIKKKHIKYLRPVIGGIALLLGVAFMLVPFIPLGYVLLFAALILLVPYVPFLRKWKSELQEKDHKNIYEKVESRIQTLEQRMTDRVPD